MFDNDVTNAIMLVYSLLYAGQLLYGLLHPDDPFWRGFTFRSDE